MDKMMEMVLLVVPRAEALYTCLTSAEHPIPPEALRVQVFELGRLLLHLSFKLLSPVYNKKKQYSFLYSNFTTTSEWHHHQQQ
jgi:hypothetical protein